MIKTMIKTMIKSMIKSTIKTTGTQPARQLQTTTSRVSCKANHAAQFDW